MINRIPESWRLPLAVVLASVLIITWLDRGKQATNQSGLATQGFILNLAGRQQAQQQQQQRKAQKTQAVVYYNATVRDTTGQEQRFSFPVNVDKATLEQAQKDPTIALQLVQQVVSPVRKPMLDAKPWKCVQCHLPATNLLLHPAPHLSSSPPSVMELGAVPVCDSKKCGEAAEAAFKQLIDEVRAEAAGTKQPTADDEEGSTEEPSEEEEEEE